MEKNRMEAFSDGVLGDHHHDHGAGDEGAAGDRPCRAEAGVAVFLSYILSFVYVGIYWNNHHHMLHATRHVSGRVLWANLHLLFWLSLFPFATGWMGENHLDALPTAVYGCILLMAAIAYWILQGAIIAQQGPNSVLATAVGSDRKGKISMVLYASAIPLAFVSPWISNGIFVLVALIWFIPDRRIERVVVKHEEGNR